MKTAAMSNLLKIGSNTKLGQGIAGFSLPAVTTCPGRTALCEGICYATSGFFRFSNVRRSLQSSYDASRQDGFASVISNEISRRSSIKAVRIHPSGDFYSAEYISSWISIVKSSPDTRFWGYTRSWRKPELLSKLKELSELPNIELFASIDEEAGRQPSNQKSPGQDGTKVPEVPPAWLRLADVVDSWDEVDSTYVQCPNLKNKDITCSKCTYCFKPSGSKKVNVAFTKH
jgi:hypothetical protein